MISISDHIPLSIQERRFSLRTSQEDQNIQMYTTGLVLVTALESIEEVKTLCENYGFDKGHIQKRQYISRTSLVIPCQPDQVLDQETHSRLF